VNSEPITTRRRRSQWLNVVISLAIFVWLLRQIPLEELQTGLRRADWQLLLLGVCFIGIGLVLRAWRWQLFVNKAQRVMTFGDAIVLTFIGCALNVLLPASMGDVAKSYYAYRRIGNKEVMLSSSLMDKAMGMLAGFVAGFPLAGWLQLWPYFWLGLGLSMLLTIILFFPRVLPWRLLSWLAERVGKQFDHSQLVAAATLSPALWGASFVLSVLAWVCTYVQFWLAFLAFGGNLGLGHVFALTPVVMLTKLIPFTLDGLGPQEAVSVSLFLHQAGVAKTVTLLATLATRAITSWLPAIIGLLLMLQQNRYLRFSSSSPDLAGLPSTEPPAP